MGPRVTPEHMEALHWYRVKRLTSVKNREAIHKFSNENYPILCGNVGLLTKKVTQQIL